MRPSRCAAIVLAAAATLGGAAAGSSRAESAAPQACNLRGSWVAGTGEANRYMSALNPTSASIELKSGSLTATFTRTQFTFGGLSLMLVGTLGRSTIKEEVDIEASAAYHVRGSRLVFGAGTYNAHYVSAVLIQNGRRTNLRLPASSIRTPGSSVAYSCSPGMLHLAVAAGGTGDAVPLALQRAH
jgi:hypothetical protein